MPRKHWTVEKLASAAGAGLIGVSAIPGIQGTRVQNVLEELAAKAGATPASDTAAGSVKVSVAPVDPANPIAVGDNDTRNTNQRAPTDLSVTEAKVAAANKDGLAATPSMRTLGTGAQEAAAGNDSRLSNARTPTAHKSTHATGGSDVILPSDIQAIGEVYDEGALITYAKALDFLGAGVIVSRNATTGRIELTISGAAAGAASETAAGITEQATEAEILAGTAGNLFATVTRLKTELDRRAALKTEMGAIDNAPLFFNAITVGAGVQKSGDLRGVNGVPADAKGVYVSLYAAPQTNVSHVGISSADTTPGGSNRIIGQTGNPNTVMTPVALGTGADAGKVAVGVIVGSNCTGFSAYVVGWWR